MSSPLVEPPIAFSDRPLPKKLLEELKIIAAAMGLDVELKKDALLRSIQRHIKTHPALADDPRFLPLFAHRSNPKGAAKTSAGKSAEEQVESSKPQLVLPRLKPSHAVTTQHLANRILLTNQVKVDPPPQFQKLSSGHLNLKTQPKLNAVDDDSESSDDNTVSPSRTATPEPDANDDKVDDKVRQDKGLTGVVQVNFFDESGRNSTPRSVIVDEVSVAVSTSQDGNKTYSTLLSKLIPAAIQNDSPIKERGGRLYRRDVRPNEPGYHQLGKIDALLAGTSSALGPKIVNEYTLRTSNEDLFVCDLYWDGLSGPATGPEAQTAAVVEEKVDGLKSVVDAGAEIHKPVAFTGAGSDVPLNIANDRALNNPMHLNAAPGLRTNFAGFVHGKVQGAVPDIPDFGEEWARCTYAGQMLDRHLLQEAVMDFLTEGKWSRTNGGFVVPRGVDPYAGVKFEKKFLLHEALNIKTSSTSDIDKYFTPDALANAPKAKAWVMSKGKEYDDRFRKMKSARFKEYIQGDHRKHRKADKIRRRRSSSASAGPSRKHKKSVASSSEEDESHRKSRGKGKGRMTEENMDD
ncbi:hypothetical protein DFH06DRAFT_1344216 [Mycena polygramma]|nr:hypothetical protein DFH06DRAFT_1344216 [Mycena polygramma]